MTEKLEKQVVEDLVESTKTVFGYTDEQLFCKHVIYSTARHLMYYILWYEWGLSCQRIDELFGKRFGKRISTSFHSPESLREKVDKSPLLTMGVKMIKDNMRLLRCKGHSIEDEEF